MSKYEGSDQPPHAELSLTVLNSVNGAEGQDQGLRFQGRTLDYFWIWLTNLALSVLTFGMYSAWAKVRRRKYFYTHTYFQNFAFNYHATGLQLFKGRALVFALLVFYAIASAYIPFAVFICFAAFIFLIPWVINKALRFNARMTSWQNMRMSWHGTYWKSFGLFVFGPFVGVLSVGVLVPWIARAYYRYYAEGHALGTTRFRSNAKVSDYYVGFFLALLGPVIIGFAVWCAVFMSIGTSVVDGAPHAAVQALPLSLFMFIFMSQFTYRAVCRNILLRSMALDKAVAFGSTLQPMMYLWIELSNAVLMVVSLSLLVPWALVRRYKYLVRHTHIELLQESHVFTDVQTKDMSAFGAEFSDIKGFDVGI